MPIPIGEIVMELYIYNCVIRQIAIGQTIRKFQILTGYGKMVPVSLPFIEAIFAHFAMLLISEINPMP